MTTPQTPRWYSVNNMGMATLCADKADAEDVARTCDIDFPRQSPHRAVQLVEAPKIHYPMAEPVAWMWRVADSDWQLESTCPPERPLAIVEPLYTGYMADAYIGASEEVEIWKRRALEAEEKLRAESAAKAGLSHMKTVQDAVSDAVAAEREACAEIATDEDNIVDVPGYSAQLGDARATARKIEKAIRARGTP